MKTITILVCLLASAFPLQAYAASCEQPILLDGDAGWSGWGIAGVAAAAAIVWTIKNCLFLSSYCASLLRLPWWSFYAPLTAGALGTLAIGSAGMLVSSLWQPADWLALGAMAVTISVLYSIIAYFLSLSRSDREMLWSILDRRPRA